MRYRFDNFTLDASKVELRQGNEILPVEPQVFALLLLLVENQDRMVSKDEIIEKVWERRIVSDSALSSRIKSARQLLGDDGKTQLYIKTIHGKGFRFDGDARVQSQSSVSPELGAAKSEEKVSGGQKTDGRPSIAILPFRLVGVSGAYAGVADALPGEMISALSRMRWLFVIARASSFRFRNADPDIAEIGAALGVRYVLSGIVEIVGDRIGVSVELADTANNGILWGERYDGNISDIHAIREKIIASAVAALEIQIPLNEARNARLSSPENLDAWSVYHLGLQHLYRFNRKDNDIAAEYFATAIANEPDFARAHAGLSSTHFQNVFLHYNDDTDQNRLAARRAAERAVELDPVDPFANFVLGRVHWVERDIAGGMGWLERAVALSPNYAQGVYARAWADSILGHGDRSEKGVDLALALSPLDPFRYGMLGVRAFTHLINGDDMKAAHWSEEAARTPGAHALIAAIAVAFNEIAGKSETAVRWADSVRTRMPDMKQEDFFAAFPFESPGMRKRIAAALRKNRFQ